MGNFSNRLKTLIFMSILTVLVIMAGGALGGKVGMIVALIFATVMNFSTYWYSDKLAISMTKSIPLDKKHYQYLYDMVERLTYNANMPMPKLYLTPSQQPNAFATGRNPENAAVAVTEGLLRILDNEELEGVIAHELAHIKNRDTLISTLAAVMAGVITTLANWAQWALIFGGIGGSDDEGEGAGGLAALPLIFLGPIAAMLVQMAISRSREYMADATGAEIAGNSRGLANALLKLEQASKAMPMNVNPATSHLFIVNPFTATKMRSLFSTHPPIGDRVKKLRNLNY